MDCNTGLLQTEVFIDWTTSGPWSACSTLGLGRAARLLRVDGHRQSRSNPSCWQGLALVTQLSFSVKLTGSGSKFIPLTRSLELCWNISKGVGCFIELLPSMKLDFDESNYSARAFDSAFMRRT